MNKNTLYIVGGVLFIIVLLAALGAYKFRHEIRAAIMPQSAPAPIVESTPTPAPAPAPQAANEVDYTDSGFSPATLTVKVGDTVKFVNKSSSGMWVASNPHPTHTDLPGFDEKSTNTEYSYTFTKVGSWGYHNHRNPSDGGTVVTQ